MEPGGIIAFRDKSSVLLALVRKDQGKQLRVLNEKGKEFPYPKARVALDTGLREDPAVSRERATEALGALRQRAEPLVAEVDLELLWESAREGVPEGAAITQLAELYFGDAPPAAQTLSLLMALEADSAYFKRKGDALVPKPPELVREVLEQQAAARRKAEEEADALVWLRAKTSGWDAPEPPGAAALVERVKQVAVLGDDAPDMPRLQALFKDFPRFGPALALELLQKLGVFSEHENLALHAGKIEVGFPAEAEAGAAELAAAPRDEPRRDLTDLETVAIDDADTTEVDDALSLEPREDGGRRLWVHIADVTAFLPKGHPVDRVAARRGTTVYVPDRTVPMIPPALSMDACSLLPGVTRPALSLRVDLDPDGTRGEWAFEATSIRVDRSMTYEAVERDLDADPLVRDLYAVARGLRAERLEAGAHSYERQELRIKANAAGEVSVKRVVGDSRGQVLVSEMMVLANRLAGTFLKERGIPGLYKRQARPKEPGAGFIPKSTMGLEPGEHYGLGLPVYCQMTSPIRRYGDLAMHRQIGAALGRPVTAHDEAELGVVLATCQDRDSAAFTAEREGKRYWLLRYLEGLKKRDTPALVNHVRRGAQVGCKLEEYLLPCMLPLPQGKSAKEGDRVLVRITAVEPRKGRVRLRYLEPLPPLEDPAPGPAEAGAGEAADGPAGDAVDPAGAAPPGAGEALHGSPTE